MPARAGRVTAVGDSVMLDAVPELESDIGSVEVDAAVSRQVATGINILIGRRAAGQLGSTVVVGLGTNGTFTSGQFDQIMQILAQARRVVFVNLKVPRSWQDANNAVLASGVPRYKTARLVDWYDASAGQPVFFAPDGFHLRPAGAAAYAGLIAAAVNAS